MKLRTIRTVEGQPTVVAFQCPGCGEEHHVWINGRRNGSNATWGFNGSFERPTFSPSLNVTSGHYVPGHNKDSCWCTYNQEHPDSPAPFKCSVCHSFVRDGRIQFLGDCTHPLKGKTVELPDYSTEAL